MTKTQRREKNQRQAQRMKDEGIERTQGRCCICYRLYFADMLDRGFQSHRCSTARTRNGSVSHRGV